MIQYAAQKAVQPCADQEPWELSAHWKPLGPKLEGLLSLLRQADGHKPWTQTRSAEILEAIEFSLIAF